MRSSLQLFWLTMLRPRSAKRAMGAFDEAGDSASNRDPSIKIVDLPAHDGDQGCRY